MLIASAAWVILSPQDDRVKGVLEEFQRDLYVVSFGSLYLHVLHGARQMLQVPVSIGLVKDEAVMHSPSSP